VALVYYVESLWEHLDGAYLKLQVALEATADRWLRHIKAQPAPPLVPDFSAWTQWIDSHSGSLHSMAQPGKGAQFIKKLLNQGRTPSTSKVALAFKYFAFALSSPLLDEVNGRNAVAHAALMSSAAAESRDVDRDLDRVGTVRVLLTALTSLIIGYRGPLLGPDIRDEQIAPQDLWSPDPQPTNSLKRYIASVLPDGSTPANAQCI
jgi:hypothetical protein